MANAIESKWETVSVVNGRSWSKRQIGWHVVEASTVYTEYGEYAGYYCNIEVPAGRYPIYACRDCGIPWHSVMVVMDGKIVSGSCHKAGNPMRYTLNLYPHQLANAVLSGDRSAELFEGVEAREINFDWKGTPQKTHGVFVDGEQI